MYSMCVCTGYIFIIYNIIYTIPALYERVRIIVYQFCVRIYYYSFYFMALLTHLHVYTVNMCYIEYNQKNMATMILIKFTVDI